jgi:hypothetical protein
MNIIYTQQPLPKSIFLAGPTPRSRDVESWRPTALELLDKALHFDGTVFTPEFETGCDATDYDEQVSWEWEAINQATIVVFWVPRDLETMPALTTNVEFGMLANSGKVVLGAPHGAPKMGYMKALAARYNIPFYNELLFTLEEAVRRTKKQYGQFN